MTDQPRLPYRDPSQPAPGTPRHDATPPPHDVTPTPQPAAPAATPGAWDDTRVYSPVRDPRAEWSPRGWAEADPASNTWQPTPVRAEPVPAERPRRRGSVAGPVLAASLLSAVLASGGTLLALNSTGALDRTSTPAATPAGATVSAQQPLTIDESSAIIQAAEKVSPAVVRIAIEGTDENQLGGDIPSGVGSGVIFDATGWILTNRHVVEDSSEMTVELKDGREFPGTVYGIDTLTDLAIVKIEPDGEDALPTAPIGDSGELKVGQLTIAIGSPLGTYSNSVTSGIVSATGRSITVEDGTRLDNLIQTDAAINPGNSGGPLLDAGGNVVGVNTAIASDSNGIGFAIPINIARPIMQQAVAGQELARPYIGIRYVAIDVQLARDLDLPVENGAYVTVLDPEGQPSEEEAVVPDGPAADAGIRDGDIILTLEGQPIDVEHPLNASLSQFAPGQTVTLEILRDGERQNVDVTLGTRPPGL